MCPEWRNCNMYAIKTANRTISFREFMKSKIRKKSYHLISNVVLDVIELLNCLCRLCFVLLHARTQSESLSLSLSISNCPPGLHRSQPFVCDPPLCLHPPSGVIAHQPPLHLNRTSSPSAPPQSIHRRLPSPGLPCFPAHPSRFSFS